MLHVPNLGFILFFRLDFKSNIILISSDLFYLMVWLGVFLDFQPGHIRLIERQTVGCHSKIKSQNTIKRNKNCGNKSFLRFLRTNKYSVVEIEFF